MLEDEKMSGVEGTVKPVEEYDTELDARRFNKAMKGSGTDEDAIMRLVAGRSNAQLKKIAETYKTCFGEELIDDMKSELTGKLEQACVGRMYNRHELSALRCKKAMVGFGTNDTMLIHEIVTRLPAELKGVSDAFNELFETDGLEHDVKGETRGDYENFLVALLSGGRQSNDEPVDVGQAQAEAQKLYDAGEGKWGTDESTFNRIMSMRSWPQLRATFEGYKLCSKRTIEEAIKSEMGGNLEKAMLILVRAAKGLHKYFAEEIYESMSGVGTDDDKLVHLIVERCEIDMVQIKKVFQATYDKTLKDWIECDVGGDEKKILLALIGEMELGDFEEE